MELSDELAHPLLEGGLVLLLDRGAHVAARRERKPGLLDLGERRRLAEARLVRVVARVGLSGDSR